MKGTYRILGPAVLAAAVAGSAALIFANRPAKPLEPQQLYDRACQRLEQQDYDGALADFAALGDYEQTGSQLERAYYGSALERREDGAYDQALAAFLALGDYEDSAMEALDCRYLLAKEQLQEGHCDEAKALFLALGDYEDSADQVRACDYAKAEALQKQGNLTGAIALWQALGDYADSPGRLEEQTLAYGAQLLEQGEITEAFSWLEQAGDPGKALLTEFWERQLPPRQVLSNGCLDFFADMTDGILCIRQDGVGVRAASLSSGKTAEMPDPALWKDLVTVRGHYGLRSDGTVVSLKKADGPLPWSAMVDVVAGPTGRWSSGTTVYGYGLRADGTVWSEYGMLPDWTNVTAILLLEEEEGVAALRSDGTVLVTEPELQEAVSTWKQVEQLYAVRYGWNDVTLFGLCIDGTVVTTREDWQQALSTWTQVEELYLHPDQDACFGICTDGTVLAVGEHPDVSAWTGITKLCGYSYWIVEVPAHWPDPEVTRSCFYLLGLREDGTVAAAGDNWNNQCDVSGWTEIVDVVTCGGSYDNINVAGLRSDGTVLVTGSNGLYQFDAAKWENIAAIWAVGQNFIGMDRDGNLLGTGGWAKDYHKPWTTREYRYDLTQMTNLRLPERAVS